MQPSTSELIKAFNRCKLQRLGYSFDSAMDCDEIKTCLVRIATNMYNKAAQAPVKQYWFNQI